MKKTRSIYLAILTVMLSPIVANAGFINGDFETGDLTGWTVGTGTSVTSSASLNASSSARINASGGGLGGSAFDAFFGLSAGAIAAGNSNCLPSSGCTQGQGMYQTVNAVAGTTISFEWLAALEGPGYYTDAAFFVADGAVYNLSLGGSASGSVLYTLLNSGPQVFGFGVINGGDNCCGANLWIDNVATAAVPEPGTLALLGLGFVGLAAARRKIV